MTKHPDDPVLELTSLQRAEFQRASDYLVWIVRTQAGIATLAAASVFVDHPNLVYLLALLIVVLTAIYAGLGYLYRNSRSLAERTRRLTLISGGLGTKIGASEYRDLLGLFSAKTRALADQIDSTGYYDCTAPVGPDRLIQKLEQNAFWSEDLLRHSGLRTRKRAAGAVALFVLMLLLSPMPLVSATIEMNAGRIIFALVPFFLSTEVFGAATAYLGASRDLGRLVAKIEHGKVAGNSVTGALTMAAEYNSAVESAPTFLPGVYEDRGEDIKNRWLRRM